MVLQAGLLLSLIDTLAALMTAVEGISESKGEIELARSTWRMASSFLRIVLASMLTLCVAFLVLCPRWRATIGDALAWSTDESSRERVKRKLTDALRASGASRVVLIGHSQGGSIAAELEPGLRSEGREVRLVTMGSGEGLLAAMHSVLPRWSLSKSIVSWTVLLAFSVLTTATLVSVLATDMHLVAPLAAAPLRIGGYEWLSNLFPLEHTRELVLHETANIAPVFKSRLIQPFSLPSVATPALIASSALAVLLVTIGATPARTLSAATHTEAPGIDIVATHDMVAAAMLQLGPVERRRRVSQCGSLLRDHTSYLRNGSVLGLLAAQVECAAGLPEDDDEDIGALAMEEYHRAGLALRSWTRPLLFVSIVGAFAWLTPGEVAPVAWISAAGACCLMASVALTASSARWLTRAGRDLDACYLTAVVRERARLRRARPYWAGILGLAGVPLIGGAAVVFTTPTVRNSLEQRPGLQALTLVAFMVGVILCALAWRSLFGFQRGPGTTVVVTLAALLWLLQGTSGSAGMAALTAVLAYWSHRRESSERRRTAAEQSGARDLVAGPLTDAPES